MCTGFCFDVAGGFVVARLAVMLVCNAVTVGGSETTLYPLALDFRFWLFDAAAESFFLFGGDSGVCAAVAAVFVSSTEGKGGFNFRKVFLDFAVL